MEKTKENKMKIEEIKKISDSISNEDIETRLEGLIAELSVVTKEFDSLFILRTNGKATAEQKKELGKLKRKSADLHWSIKVCQDILKGE